MAGRVKATAEVNWQALPYSSRMALLRVANLLEGGFTGRIELDCGQGGVRALTHGRRETPDDIENAFQNGRSSPLPPAS